MLVIAGGHVLFFEPMQSGTRMFFPVLGYARRLGDTGHTSVPSAVSRHGLSAVSLV